MESHLLFSTQQETSHFINKTERLFLEVCKVLIIWILIIVCGLSFGWRFLIIFRISSVEKSIVGTDSSVFFFPFLFFISCFFLLLLFLRVAVSSLLFLTMEHWSAKELLKILAFSLTSVTNLSQCSSGRMQATFLLFRMVFNIDQYDFWLVFGSTNLWEKWA